VNFAGIPVVVSPYVPRGTAYFMPSSGAFAGGRFCNGGPVIIADRYATVSELLDCWLKSQDAEFLRRCGVIYDLEER